MLVYELGNFLFRLFLYLLSPFHNKAKKFVQGRKKTWEDLAISASDLKGGILFHCSSLGEFEQGRPLIEKLHKAGEKIILTFFSPSGYEIRKDYKLAEKVLYLPFDSKKNAKKFLEKIEPKLIVIVKYDLWYHFLNQAVFKKIPIVLISASFKKEFAFFKPYGAVFRKMLSFINEIYVQDEHSKELLKTINVSSKISGDTRIDRVLEIAKSAEPFHKIEKFVGENKCLIVGSSWKKDEQLLNGLARNEVFRKWKMILAPHDVSKSHIKQLEDLLEAPYVKFSNLDDKDFNDVKILIIDNIGMLSQLYQYGDLAYIGGGFGQGIHNTLEPAAFELPILFGPKIDKFPEAVYLEEKKAAFVINTEAELLACFEKLKDEKVLAFAKEEIRSYLKRNKGASELILKELKKFVV